ncbi:MAG: CRISPR-associated endonuclease Cas3'', partial [Planctomycetota bacterium]
MLHYAHSTEGPESQWEPLRDHLRRVAIGENGYPGARQFADVFSCAEWGELAGWWHDLGKYSDKFQRRIGAGDDATSLEVSERVDHSTAGAKHAASLDPAGKILSYAIAGHHGGIPDMHGPGRGNLYHRLTHRDIDDWTAAPTEIVQRPLPTTLPLKRSGNPAPFTIAFRIRMLFSCLVDADWLWTEYFYDPEVMRIRRRNQTVSIQALADQLSRSMSRFEPEARVNKIRAEILQDCVDASLHPPGFFSLHVPTGGGKTLSSLTFALRHAARHGQQRVIYAIPLTSIIEQTAKTFADIFGQEAVLEHHSGLNEQQLEFQTRTQRLATENFDAPLIVTTNVQILESLFANKPSKCRKLHRFANSVIIFDEAQALPVDLLRPTLAALRELVSNHGCTIVLCSATQPAVARREAFDIGLERIEPMIADPRSLHERLRRTTVEMIGSRNVDELARDIGSHAQALAILNSRRHAR